MSPVSLRPRSTTELIDAAVQIMRRYYPEILTASAILLVPALILQLLVGSVRTGTVAADDRSFLLYVGTLVTALLSIVSTSAVIAVASDGYLGREVSVMGALQRVVPRFWSVFAAGLLQSVLVGIGFILLIIPGLICLAWFFAGTVVVVVEGTPAAASLRRSRQLVTGSVGRVLGVLCLTALLLVVIEMIVVLAISVLSIFVHASPALTTLGASLANLVAYPFFTVVITLLYYDLRIRKEGFDLTVMTAELGQGPAVSASPA
jgi:hypothetical protein